MSKVEKTIRFRTWKELLKAVKEYESHGISCEVKGWDAMRTNKLTIKEADE